MPSTLTKPKRKAQATRRWASARGGVEVRDRSPFDDDATAIAYAEQLADAETIEIWEGKRMVDSGRFASSPPNVAA